MGKKKNNDFTPMSDLMEEKKKLEKKMGKISIPCSHTNDNGKVKFDFLGKGNLVRCKKCGCTFDFGTIDPDDLHKAVLTVHNAINQVKSMTDDPNREAGVINTLGNLDYNMKEMEELYRKTVFNYHKGGKKKKNRKNNDFGQYGYNNIDFIGTKPKKNKYY